MGRGRMGTTTMGGYIPKANRRYHCTAYEVGGHAPRLPPRVETLILNLAGRCNRQVLEHRCSDFQRALAEPGRDYVYADSPAYNLTYPWRS